MSRITHPKVLAQAALLFTKAKKETVGAYAEDLRSILEPIFSSINYLEKTVVWEKVAKELRLIPSNSAYALIQMRLGLRGEYNNLIEVAGNTDRAEIGRARRFAIVVAKHFSQQM